MLRQLHLTACVALAAAGGGGGGGGGGDSEKPRIVSSGGGGFEAFWDSGGSWPPLVLSCLIALAALITGMALVRHGKGLTFNPLILCSVTGLLIGLALLVVLPQAVERLVQVMDPEVVFLLFLAAPVAMFIFEHVVLEHEHLHMQADGTMKGCDDEDCDGCIPENSKPPESSSPGAGWSMNLPGKKKKKGSNTPSERTPLIKGGKAAVAPAKAPAEAPADESAATTRVQRSKSMPADLPGVRGGGPSDAPSSPSSSDGASEARRSCSGWAKLLMEQWSLIMRLGAWVLHSLFDGIILGSSDPKASVQLPLGFAILVCAVQDVAGMYIYFTARKSNRRLLITGIVMFCAAFPIGTGVSIAALYGTRESQVIDIMRVCMAGLFVYMALFEMAPPHAHGRLQNLKYALAFCFGLASAYLADAFEESMHPHRQEDEDEPSVFVQKASPYGVAKKVIKAMMRT